MLKTFFKDNFVKLSKQKENYRALNAYITFFDRKREIELMSGKTEVLKLEENEINDLVLAFKEKVSYLLFNFTYYVLYVNYDLITPENKQVLVASILSVIKKSLNMNDCSLIQVAILSKLFDDMNMKHKKEIIKEVFSLNFIQYFKSEPNFIFLLLNFISKIKDEKVINITLLKHLRANYGEFFSNVDLAKLLLIFLHQNFEERLNKEKIFLVNELTLSFINLKSIFANELFVKNCGYIADELV